MTAIVQIPEKSYPEYIHRHSDKPTSSAMRMFCQPQLGNDSFWEKITLAVMIVVSEFHKTQKSFKALYIRLHLGYPIS